MKPQLERNYGAGQTVSVGDAAFHLEGVCGFGEGLTLSKFSPISIA